MYLVAECETAHKVLLSCKFVHQLSGYTVRVPRTFHANLHNEIGLICTDLVILQNIKLDYRFFL